ncbi:hypothetical protein GUITHDRAFT_105657 [Guillardia theta CCMP2712]|uniref:Uncharacterized protein n=1 Tax=Guillardia theta (strain CCMP2712) TaxID=905079 RepID=L1JJ37_GUITC|nr:hypothetical protein GUITHDRAFT_105657 [Guillardia theta CCMP2712]EKX48511.1 hypothetical protein GUITHDRAFT_105657 [Guillardia theta CCMP2712]|eukprot:XP_005835491.1 hypothetical protein GUITHDRAFT_105657 [Guillardia theta CCMP2712]
MTSRSPRLSFVPFLVCFVIFLSFALFHFSVLRTSSHRRAHRSSVSLLQKLYQNSDEKTYNHARLMMNQALHRARDFAKKADEEKLLEGNDDRLHAKLVKIARDRAETLEEDDEKARRIENVANRLERSLLATSQVVNLHEDRLESLMAEERRAKKKARSEQDGANELSASLSVMKGSVKKLEQHVEKLKRNLKEDEGASKKTGALADLSKLVNRFSSKQEEEVKEEEKAKRGATKADKRAKDKQEEALKLQGQVDKIQKQLVEMGCKKPSDGSGGAKGSKCNREKEVDLLDEMKTMKRQIKVLEEEVLFEKKQRQVMLHAAALQHKLGEVDKYRKLEYQSKLHAAKTRLQQLRKDIDVGPEEEKAAELNLKLAEQAEERVKERLKLAKMKIKTYEEEEKKSSVLSKVQSKEIHKLSGLEASQQRAVQVGRKAEEEERRIVSAQSRQVQNVLEQARRVKEDAIKHSNVASRWESAATAETEEASAFGKEEEELSGEKSWGRVADMSSRQASELRHGLQLMDMERAVRDYQRDPRASNRHRLERLEKILTDRLGHADDAKQNEASIDMLNTIEDVLYERRMQKRSDRRGRREEEVERRRRGRRAGES